MVIRSKELKALILVGGFGTRMQPITLTTPKPLLPLVNRPILEHQIEALAKMGVQDVILAMNYKYKHIISSVKGFASKYGTRITYSLEKEPLGTAGPIALARKYLENCTFFVLNSDIICNFPFKELIEFHRENGALGTILATNVEDPRKFGVIKTRGDLHVIESFVEKPQEFVGNRINAGIYVFEPEILDYFGKRPSSIEKEIFPVLASLQHLHVYDLLGFWMDVGTPKGYLEAQRLYLESRKEKLLRFGRDVEVDEKAKIGKYVSLGNGVRVGKNANIENCIVFDNAEIGDGVRITNSIVGRECCIEGSVAIDSSIVGDKTKIKASLILE